MLLQGDPISGSFFAKLADAVNSVPMDAYRRGSDVWAHIDIPGVVPESIDVTVERNWLTITGERVIHRQEDDQVFLNERKSGEFKRQINIGNSLDVDNMEADYQDGVLTLRVPVAEKAMPKKINVKVGVPLVSSTDADESAEG